MLESAGDASNEIFKKRKSLVNTLDEIECILRRAIENHYGQMLIVNQALTAHLRSAAEVTATREELMLKLIIDAKEIIPIEKINTLIEKILTFRGEPDDLKNIVNEVSTTIK